MKRSHLFLCIVFIALGRVGLSQAEGDASRETTEQASQRIRAARDNLVQKRTLSYYVAEERVPNAQAKETAMINAGSVILAGRFLAPPYEVSMDNDFIAINGVAVEPRFTLSGEMKQKNLPEKDQAEVAAAELIAQKRMALYEETGDFALVMPRLVAYAKSLDSVQHVRVDGDVVTVTFGSNGATSEVGYICREMRKSSSSHVTSLLDEEYRDICSWLREGKCVFVPLKGLPKAELPTLPRALNTLLKKEVESDSTWKQIEHEIALVSECFATPITADDAAVITANWHRSDPVP